MTNLERVLRGNEIKVSALARDLKVSNQALYDYRQGYYWPRLVVLKRLLNYLKPYGVTIEDILPNSHNNRENL